MQTADTAKKQIKSTSLLQKIKTRILLLFRLTNEPVVKVYHGIGTEKQMIVFGHVFSLSPLPRKKYRKTFWTNTLALVRSFMVRPVKAAQVRMTWDGKAYEATTARDGFFRFEFRPTTALSSGTHKVRVDCYKTKRGIPHILASGVGTVVTPYTSTFALVSDIDDTFLISHSAKVFRKLYVLLTKNAHSRKPFEGVVKHYQLLANMHADKSTHHPFFYVSSSEWNLYDFIKEFIRKNDLPEGVFLLSQVKRLSEIWKTGGTKHATKFMRIARIMEAYPTQKFVLLGDDSQQDPVIYNSIVCHFPERIIGVYLRHVYEKNLHNVRELIKSMESRGVPVCHFEHSRDAIEHSYKIGLITREEIVAKAKL